MNNNTRCFILGSSGYEEISYAELQERRANNPAYADKRFLRLHGMLMEVTEADYRDFYRELRRGRYLDEEADRVGALSYNTLDSEEMSGEDTIVDATAPSVEEIVSEKLLVEAVRLGWRSLSRQERVLLTALLFDGKSERELAKETGIPRMTLCCRKVKALDQLKRMIKI